MAICDCGNETSRVKVMCTGKDGRPVPEPWPTICRQCKPDEFDRWVDPSNTHGGFRYQYEPNKYKKRELADGRIFYEATDERNADLEAQLLAPGTMEKKAAAKLEERKKHRRTTPLTPEEHKRIVDRAHNMIEERRLAQKFAI